MNRLEDTLKFEMDLVDKFGYCTFRNDTFTDFTCESKATDIVRFNTYNYMPLFFKVSSAKIILCILS